MVLFYSITITNHLGKSVQPPSYIFAWCFDIVVKTINPGKQTLFKTPVKEPTAIKFNTGRIMNRKITVPNSVRDL